MNPAYPQRESFELHVPGSNPRLLFIADEDSSGQSTSQLSRDSLVKELRGALGEVEDSESRNVVEQSDAFWGKLRLAAERKVGAAEAERFCEAFRQVHRKLVYEELTLDAAKKFIDLSKSQSE
ncbi:hypothetical protein EUGRSUZ_J00674 [Eucalyptus grandis]|uniref:Uncharacterized protein n=2 Tax=Eucalyptus grandis TaxID=71139 RepID=A0ACC3J2S4_EUCGR|nr:hypothetical protein EUGRSUZ_J00674 [Eucalyptus grandis]